MTERRRVLIVGTDTMVGAALVRRFSDDEQFVLVGTAGQPDWSGARAVERLFAESQPDHVVVAAGRTAGIAGNQRSPVDLMLDNLLVAAHVVPAAWRHGVTKLIYLISSCTYPREAPQPLAVESLWTGPVEATSAAYATAKLAAIRLCEAYRQQYGARFIPAIKADTFGPGDDFSPANSHVIGGLIRRMHEAKLSGAATVDIWGTGTPRREFIYVDDLADALVFVLRNYHDAAPINVGVGTTTSIRELAELLREVVGYGGELRYDTSRPDGRPLNALDSSALQALGWVPAWDLKTALVRTYESFLTQTQLHDAVL